jgi:spermidine/putrescine transport system ATP-binding protein
MLLTAEPAGENVLPVTVGEVAFEGNFITVSAMSDSGANLTAEIRNDGSASVPQREARMFMRFDPARAAILPDDTAKA